MSPEIIIADEEDGTFDNSSQYLTVVVPMYPITNTCVRPFFLNKKEE